MNIKFLSAKWGELEFTNNPTSACEKIITGATCLLATNERQDYSFLIQELTSDDFRLRHCQFHSSLKETFTILSEAMITLRISLYHSHQFSIPYLGLLTFHERNYNLLYLPELSMQFTTRANDQFNFLDIVLTKEQLKNINANHNSQLSEFINKAKQKQPAKLCSNNPVATIETLRWLDELLESIYSPAINLHRVNYLIQQLVSHALHCIGDLIPSDIKNHQPGIEEANKIYAAAQYLQSSNHTISLNELANLLSIKPFTLKQNFKKIFGHSATHHRTEEKMRQALRLVNDSRYTRKQVVAILQYKNASDFSRDFKRRFGYPPYRKMQK